jgi:hypothetical protein
LVYLPPLHIIEKNQYIKGQRVEQEENKSSIQEASRLAVKYYFFSNENLEMALAKLIDNHEENLYKRSEDTNN